jgi:6-phosphofructokinase
MGKESREIMSKMRTIAVINAGGDAPGLNAMMRGTGSAIVQAARAFGTTFGGSA